MTYSHSVVRLGTCAVAALLTLVSVPSMAAEGRPSCQQYADMVIAANWQHYKQMDQHSIAGEHRALREYCRQVQGDEPMRSNPVADMDFSLYTN